MFSWDYGSSQVQKTGNTEVFQKTQVKIKLGTSHKSYWRAEEIGVDIHYFVVPLIWGYSATVMLLVNIPCLILFIMHAFHANI